MAVPNPKRLLTVEEFLEMAESGLFAEDARLELIEGEIVEMAPIGKRHAGCVRRLIRLLTGSLGTRAVVDIQNAAWIDEHSFFCPDAFLLREGFLDDEYPTPQDIHLVIEVADSSLSDDRRFKMPVYARVGIPEAWLVAIKEGTTEGTIYVYRRPSPEGYREVREYRRGDEISPEAFPDVSFAVDAILG
jgi:Uma2 family endonuclease